MIYREKKEQARQEAIDFKSEMSAEKWDYTLENGYSYYELIDWRNYFVKLGKKIWIIKRI